MAFLALMGALWFTPIAQGYGIFYQPLTKDSDLTARQWLSIIEDAKGRGATSLVLQWSRYQSVDFNRTGGLRHAIAAAQAHNMPYWFGLALPDGYFTPGPPNDLAFTAGFKQGLSENNRYLATLELLGFDSGEHFKGWYLPMELSTRDLRKPETLSTVVQALEKFTSGIDAPVAISYYLSTDSTEQNVLAHVGALMKAADVLWVQRGNGLVNPPDLLPLLPQLPCFAGIVNELFIETRGAGEQFTASEMSLPPEAILLDTCHPQYVFSLRYLPDSLLPR